MAFWIPIALMAASAASGAMGAKKEKKAYAAARQLAFEGRQDFNNRTAANIDTLQNHAEDTYGAGRGERWAQSAADMAAARMGEIDAAGPQKVASGAELSPEQLEYAGRLATKEGARLHDAVKLLSRVSAPQTAGFREGLAGAQFAGDFNSRALDARGMARAYGADVDGRMQGAATAGSGWKLLSSLFAKGAQMYGMGMGGGG